MSTLIRYYLCLKQCIGSVFYIFYRTVTSSKLLASLIRNSFSKRPPGAPLQHLAKVYDVAFGFVTQPPMNTCLALFAAVVGGGYSTSDDLSCSYVC